MWWPKSDEICYDEISKGIAFLKQAAALCHHKRCAVQAGGNAGMYPIALAGIFCNVVTAEPENINFRCLSINIVSRPDIKAHHAAFAAEDGEVELQGWDKNTVSFKTVPGSGYKAITIDSLALPDVDFIQLDIEGGEAEALVGALDTIERCRPVIMVERRGHGPDPHEMLEQMGYQHKMSNDTDSVYLFEGHA